MDRTHRPRNACLGALSTLLAALALALALAAPAGAAATTGAGAEGKRGRTVLFDGQQVRVPAGWPVYRLAQHPGMCVRLDRRAVYLGTPAANQRCPSDLKGRRRAILVEPAAQARAAAVPWAGASAAATASAGGAVYTGLGFDACTAPSSAAMNTWLKSSPYRAVGVYIGGLNRACSQPNLTASWVETHTAKGWHLIPTYVGLQAPTSACSSCAKLNATQATAQGIAAANDAVRQAAALGMGPGSPIYNDMEAYTRTASATAATMAFLEAWTERLHALGYTSGVYSSSASGIADLVKQIGTGYTLPDDVWFANWNGVANATDPYIPSNAWSQRQRIHQYRGGHNETWGGVTINIDNNYVDGATVGIGGPAGGDDPIGWLDLAGSPIPGHVRVRGWAFDPNRPTQALGVRLYVGGRAGSPNALAYELGSAGLSRPDITGEYPEAGALHGFDTTLAVPPSGRQAICVYGIDLGPGSDSLLGCKTARVPAAVTFAKVLPLRGAVQVRVACAWPAGTACPGQLSLRTSVKVRSRAGGRLRLRTVKRSLGRERFQLTGQQAQAIRVPLSAGGRALLRQRGRLRVQLVAAIPGGKRVQVLQLEQR